MNSRTSAAGMTIALMLLSWLLVSALAGSNFSPATCLSTRCFCEAPRATRLVMQPANAWSSFAFVWLGSLIIFRRRFDQSSALPPDASAVFGIAAIITGVGSFLLHATLTLWGQFADVLGMYLISAFGLVYALTRWRNWPRERSIGVYMAIATGLVLSLLIWPETRRWMFALVMVAALAMEIIFARPKRAGVRVSLLLLGIAANALAFVIWILDQTGKVCSPNSLLQGHAIWHLLGAVSVWMTYCYYHSERHTQGE
jgi:dihydroceramidase